MPLSKDSIPLGDCVLLQNVEDPKRYIKNGIIIPHNIFENEKLVKAKVIRASKRAEEQEGLVPGMIVLYDKHSIFAEAGSGGLGTEKVGQYVLTKSENIIVEYCGEEE